MTAYETDLKAGDRNFKLPFFPVRDYIPGPTCGQSRGVG